jgi:hypothetical protein
MEDKPKLKKKDFRLLEKVFSAEINGLLPFQSRSKEYKRLEEEGLVQWGEEVMPEGKFVFRIKGWYLTHAGRYEYCRSCPEELGMNETGEI